ncbi:MAG: 16S rRNA (guanine(527)-N(7))-methyltransferase RsmG [Lachnospiraceae bacterium]|nr:16S rRNA (guanine(527)-N(7))-methyltransferase RsmG [Lachnospiraceae bacterium]
MEEKVRDRIDVLTEKLELLDITVSQKQTEQFLMFYEMMVNTNQVMNLTSITEPVEVMDKHFVDSLAVKRIYDLNQKVSVIDVGTGAGFPGIPLKIVFPEIHIVLLDSLNKRVKFLKDVVEALGLENVECIHGRSEDIGRADEYREKFDLCVSRAVANLSVLSELCIPFVKIGGRFISYKAGKSAEEIEDAKTAVRKLGGKVRKVEEFSLPGTELERVFVEIEKIRETERKYPRKAGTPEKMPLK